MDLFDIVFGQPELVATVVGPLCFVDRLSLSFTCRLTHTVVGEYVVSKVSAALRDCLTPMQYKDVQEGSMVVSGPILLQILCGEEPVADAILYLRYVVKMVHNRPVFHSLVKNTLKAGKHVLIECAHFSGNLSRAVTEFDRKMLENSYSGGKLRLVDSEALIRREAAAVNKSLEISYEKTREKIERDGRKGSFPVLYTSDVARL